MKPGLLLGILALVATTLLIRFNEGAPLVEEKVDDDYYQFSVRIPWKSF